MGFSKEAQEIIEDIAIAIYFRHTALKVGIRNTKPWHELPLEETKIYWDDAKTIFGLLRVKGYGKRCDLVIPENPYPDDVHLAAGVYDGLKRGAFEKACEKFKELNKGWKPIKE